MIADVDTEGGGGDPCVQQDYVTRRSGAANSRAEEGARKRGRGSYVD